MSIICVYAPSVTSPRGLLSPTPALLTRISIALVWKASNVALMMVLGAFVSAISAWMEMASLLSLRREVTRASAAVWEEDET